MLISKEDVGRFFKSKDGEVYKIIDYVPLANYPVKTCKHEIRSFTDNGSHVIGTDSDSDFEEWIDFKLNSVKFVED